MPSVCCLPIKLSEAPSSCNHYTSHPLPQVPSHPPSVPAPMLSSPPAQLRSQHLEPRLFHLSHVSLPPFLPLSLPHSTWQSVLSKYRSDHLTPPLKCRSVVLHLHDRVPTLQSGTQGPHWSGLDQHLHPTFYPSRHITLFLLLSILQNMLSCYHASIPLILPLASSTSKIFFKVQLKFFHCFEHSPSTDQNSPLLPLSPSSS